jgi:hypothetical protein
MVQFKKAGKTRVLHVRELLKRLTQSMSAPHPDDFSRQLPAHPFNG